MLLENVGQSLQVALSYRYQSSACVKDGKKHFISPYRSLPYLYILQRHRPVIPVVQGGVLHLLAWLHEAGVWVSKDDF